MKCITFWILATILLAAPQGAIAQRPTTLPGASQVGPPAKSADEEALDDFTHAVVLQATPRQAMQFMEWSRNTKTASTVAEKLMRRQSTDIVHGADDLLNALDDSEWAGNHFLAGFYPTQKAGLKSERKKLSKAQAAISKRTRQLQAARSAGDETGIVETSARLVDSLAKLQTLQSAVANAMAISF